MQRFLFAPIDNTFLACFRIAFGAILLWQVWTYFSGDVMRAYYIEPTFHFTWYGCSWIKPWPGDGMYLHFYLLGVWAMCILLGFYYRLAALLFCAGFTYVFLIDQAWYLNHHYLVCLLSFLCIFLPAHQTLSLDSWRRPRLRADTAPAWTLWLLRAQIGIPYFYAGLAKLNVDWLHGEPLRTWLAESTDVPVIGRWLTAEWCVYLFVYGGLLLDLFVVPLLLWRRTRLVTFLVVLLFHLLNAVLFDIGIFPWLMIAATALVYFPPETIARFRFRRAAVVAKPVDDLDDAVPLSARQRWIVAALFAYLTLQLLIPLRHHLYPGRTAWSREGHYFSWRMKLNNRPTTVDYFVTDPETKIRSQVQLQRWITLLQEPKISHPDMMLQLAHFLARQLSDNPDQPVEIRARVTVALNGRAEQTFIDPEVNLAAEQRGWRHAEWIIPMKPD